MSEDQEQRLLQVTEQDLSFSHHEEISELTLDQAQGLVQRYYNGENTSKLILDFDLTCRPSQLYQWLPPVTLESCDNCDEGTIICDRPSKGKKDHNYLEAAYCFSCGHQPYTWCKCAICQAKREEEARRQREEKVRLIRETYDLDQLSPIALEKLTVRDRIYLAALIRMGMDENLEMTIPMNEWAEDLTPSGTNDLDVLRYLVRRQIISPHPNSSLNAFTDNDDTPFPRVYYLNAVGYHVNVDIFRANRRVSIEMLSSPSMRDLFMTSEIDDFVDGLLELWIEIAIGEALEYLEMKLRKVNLIKGGLPDKNRAELIFTDLLKDYSTAHLYNFIFRSVKDGLHFQAEKGIRSSEKIVKFIVGRCRTLAERALAEGWEIKAFRRDYGFQQSVLGGLLYNKVLRLGEKAFELIPNINSIGSAVDLHIQDFKSKQEVASSQEEDESEDSRNDQDAETTSNVD